MVIGFVKEFLRDVQTALCTYSLCFNRYRIYGNHPQHNNVVVGWCKGAIPGHPSNLDYSTGRAYCAL